MTVLKNWLKKLTEQYSCITMRSLILRWNEKVRFNLKTIYYLWNGKKLRRWQSHSMQKQTKLCYLRALSPQKNRAKKTAQNQNVFFANLIKSWEIVVNHIQALTQNRPHALCPKPHALLLRKEIYIVIINQLNNYLFFYKIF